MKLSRSILVSDSSSFAKDLNISGVLCFDCGIDC